MFPKWQWIQFGFLSVFALSCKERSEQKETPAKLAEADAKEAQSARPAKFIERYGVDGEHFYIVTNIERPKKDNLDMMEVVQLGVSAINPIAKGEGDDAKVFSALMYSKAESGCQKLGWISKTWRLPTFAELKALYYKGQGLGPLIINLDGFKDNYSTSGEEHGFFWSSDEMQDFAGGMRATLNLETGDERGIIATEDHVADVVCVVDL